MPLVSDENKKGRENRRRKTCKNVLLCGQTFKRQAQELTRKRLVIPACRSMARVGESLRWGETQNKSRLRGFKIKDVMQSDVRNQKQRTTE